jgi:hypothetical protein
MNYLLVYIMSMIKSVGEGPLSYTGPGLPWTSDMVRYFISQG